jgi:hypothetical protein
MVSLMVAQNLGLVGNKTTFFSSPSLKGGLG